MLLLLFILSVSANAQQPCDESVDQKQSLNCADKRATQSAEEEFVLSDEAPPSLLTRRWDLEQDHEKHSFRPYRPVYLLPLFYSSHPNTLPQTGNPDTSLSQPLNLDHLETKFQISLKTKLVNDIFADNGDLWMGYTQSSRWQVFNEAESRPFRETNHEPELIFVWRTAYRLLGWDGRLLSVSYNHQSNGQNEPLSRSWNRVILTVGFDRPDWILQFRPWWRSAEISEEDENPEILDYMGRGEIQLIHRANDTNQFSARLRHSFKSGDESRGSLDLHWAYPCFKRQRCHAQLFRGYGESLVDYNHLTTSIGVGVDLIDWF